MPASRHRMAAGERPDALLLEHDLVAPVVDRDAGEDPCGHDTGDAAGCAAQA